MGKLTSRQKKEIIARYVAGEKVTQIAKSYNIWTEIDKELAKIIPDYVPFEMQTKKEQEEAYDRVFDWENE